MEDDPPLVDMWFHLVWVIAYLILIIVSYRLSYIRRPIMYILNQSIGCQSSPISIIVFLHLYAIVLPISCGSYLGLSFDPGGVVESPKTPTWFRALMVWRSLLKKCNVGLTYCWCNIGNLDIIIWRRFRDSYFATFYYKWKLELAGANQRLASYRGGPEIP